MKKRFWTSPGALLIVDGLIAALFTLGFARPLFFSRSLDLSWAGSFAACLLAAGLVSLLCLRWWIVPALLLLSLLPATYILSQLELLQDTVRQIINWFSWAGQRLVLGGPEPEQASWLIGLQLLLILIISLPVYLLVHKAARFWILAIPVLLTVIPFLLRFPTAISQVLPALAGLIVLLPATLIHHVNKQHPAEDLPRAPLQWLALPVAIISVLAGQLITPADTSHWRQQDWINRLYDLRDFWQNQQGVSRSWQAFDLATAGYSSTQTRLGGPVRLSEQVYFDVDTVKPVLLRGTTRTIYTGSSWRSPIHQVYRLNSPLWRLARRQIFVEDMPAGSDGRAFVEQFGETLTINIRPRTRLQSALFSAGKLQTIQWNEPDDQQPYFTIDGDLFVFGGLPSRPAYTVEAFVWQRDRLGFARTMREMASAPQRTRDPYWTAIRDRNLQLPDDLPEIIGQTARQIIGDETDPYGQAVLLEAYFQQEFLYTLDAEFPPDGMDFIAHLLQEGQGYCVHFATAMAVMARTLDLPARYVEGFALSEAGLSGQRWQATGRTAHAWCEIYFQGVGWLTFDPTPAAYSDPEEDPDDPDVEPEPEPTEKPLRPSLTISPPPEATTPVNPLNWLLLPAGLLLLALLIHLLVSSLIREHLRSLRLPVMHRLYPDDADCLDLAYRDILQQLSCLDVMPQDGETLSDFAGRAEPYLGFPDVDLQASFWPVVRLRYGNLPPSLPELDQLLQLRLRLEDRLRGSLSRSAWFFRRVLPARLLGRKKNKKTEKPVL